MHFVPRFFSFQIYLMAKKTIRTSAITAITVLIVIFIAILSQEYDAYAFEVLAAR